MNIIETGESREIPVRQHTFGDGLTDRERKIVKRSQSGILKPMSWQEWRGKPKPGEIPPVPKSQADRNRAKRACRKRRGK